MLRPPSIAVLLSLVVRPFESYARSAALLSIGKSAAHAAVRDLEKSGLVDRVSRDGVAIARGPVLEFLQFGAAYAYPAEMSARARGVPTGFSAPGLRDMEFIDHLPTVWPSHLGDLVGRGIKPLVPAAAEVALRDAGLYRALALFDALRLADARERSFVREEMRALIESAPR